jgi:hypothetical protein
MKRLGILATSLLFASVVACGASKTSGDDFLEGEDQDSGVDPDGGSGDTGGGGRWDVNSDVDPDSFGDAACASSEAEAIKPPVDIIMVIDQSGSMSEEIKSVKENINKLSDTLAASGLDYRLVMIGTVGTTTYALCVPPPLGGPATDCTDTSKPLRNSLPPTFRTSNQNVQSTNALSLTLSTYSSTVVGIGWADAIRADSYKAIIPVTDDNSALAAASFDTQLLAKDPAVWGTVDKRKYGAYPVMGASTYPSETKCGSGMVNNGPAYIQLVKLVGGQWYPLCSNDWAKLFTDMASSIASRVACELTIPPAPAGQTIDPNKVNVTYTPSSGGDTETIVKDDSAPCDGGANGWQYNADQTKVLLCGSACTKIQADTGAKVNIAFGCGTVFK